MPPLIRLTEYIDGACVPYFAESLGLESHRYKNYS
jgi:hypothetical protein